MMPLVDEASDDASVFRQPGWSLTTYLVPVAVAPPAAAQLVGIRPFGEGLFAEFSEQPDLEEDAQDLQDARDTMERYRRGEIGDFIPYGDYRRQR